MAPDSEDFVVAAQSLLAASRQLAGWPEQKKAKKQGKKQGSMRTILYKIYRLKIEDYEIQNIQKHKSTKYTKFGFKIQNTDLGIQNIEKQINNNYTEESVLSNYTAGVAL